MKNYKENLIFVIGTMIILGTHLVSCERIPPPPVVEPELKPSIELTVTPDGEIPYGGIATLKWKTVNALRVFVDGERQENYKEGNKGTGKLFKTTTFTIKAVNVKLFTTEMVTIEVGPWWDSTFGRVSYLPWRYKSWTITSLDGKLLSTLILGEEEKSWIFYYHKNGVTTFSNHPNVTEPWYLKNDSTLVSNGVERKLKVDQEEMIISYQTTWNGQQVWFNMVFEHASSTPTDPVE